MRASFSLFLAIVGIAGFALMSPAAPVTDEQADFFERSVRPLLAENCFECHSTSTKENKSGLLLDSAEGLNKGGKSGPAIDLANLSESLLLRAVKRVDEKISMPPKKELTSAQMDTLQKWVAMGAPYPETKVGSEKSKTSGKDFWAFHPVKKVTPPPTANGAIIGNEIDAFISHDLAKRGLPQATKADPGTLLRRITFDLTGLPPSPEETENFLSNDSVQEFEAVVDRLLRSPEFGVQWGRHWLDLVRYADTSGCNSDYPVPDAYKYRNYVVQSFNQDKPYDLFLKEQIAGDLLPSSSEAQKHERIIATGYLANTRRFGSRAAEFHLSIEDAIDNLGKTMLGLSVSCARCHDHKFDPVTVADYYGLYGILNSTKFAFPGTEIYKHPKDFVVLTEPGKAAEINALETELAELDDKIERLQERKKALSRPQKKEGNEESRPDSKEEKNIPLLEAKAELEDARQRQRQIENRIQGVERAYAVSEGKPANAKIQVKGEPGKLGAETPRKFLDVLGGQTLPADCKQSGRLELSEWIASPSNPLTARVMVNRIWQHLLGRGIVATPNDFGVRGEPPSNPELLDFLATRFVEEGWSVKKMIRYIVMSHAYQQAAVDDATLIEKDLNNQYFSRHERRRLSAEEIRDAIMAISGGLDYSMGEAHPFPPSTEWKYTQHKPFVALYETNRRSIYLMQQRIRKHPFLEVFDGADPNATTAVRPISTTALQALFLMNNALVAEHADRLAVRLALAFRTDAERIQYGYQLVFNREADASDIADGEQFLKETLANLHATGIPKDQRERTALASLCRVLLSSNEFLYLN